jgi:type II secretory pathway component PulK
MIACFAKDSSASRIRARARARAVDRSWDTAGVFWGYADLYVNGGTPVARGVRQQRGRHNAAPMAG